MTNPPIEAVNKRPELRALTGIRALAAGWVVLEHFYLIIFGLIPEIDPIYPWIRSGFLGVEVFFVLSGFIIAYNYADRFVTFSWSAYIRFLELRVARIYPVHLVALIGLAVIVAVARSAQINLKAEDNYTFFAFVGNVFNLQALPAIATWNNPAWSISTEFAAYMAFPLLALVIARIIRPSSAFTAAAAVSLLGVVAILLAAQYDPAVTSAGIIWLRISFEFTTGCLLYAGWRLLGRFQAGRAWDVCGVLCVLAVGLVVGLVDFEGVQAFLAVPAIALFVLSCAGATGPLSSLLSRPVMMWGGRISYSVYMTHFIMLMVLGELVPYANFLDAPLLARFGLIGFYLGMVVAVGALTYYVIEEPGRRLVRRIASQPKRRRSQPVGQI